MTALASCTTRPLTPGDASSLLDLLARYSRAVIGRPDYTPEDVRTELNDPDLDPRSPALVSRNGALIGAARVWHHGSAPAADLDVQVWPVGDVELYPALLREAERLVAQRARALGHDRVVVDHGLHREDTRTAPLLRDAGYAVATTFHRMRRHLSERVEVVLPPGVSITRAASGRDQLTDGRLRDLHRLHAESFSGHFGFVERPYGEWLAARDAREDWGDLWWASLDGELVGFCQETEQFAAEKSGYVLQLGVLPHARGRGIARALLLTSFAAMRDRGREAATLTVDTANATGATRLYESAGMRAYQVLDVWRRELVLS